MQPYESPQPPQRAGLHFGPTTMRRPEKHPLRHTPPARSKNRAGLGSGSPAATGHIKAGIRTLEPCRHPPRQADDSSAPPAARQQANRPYSAPSLVRIWASMSSVMAERSHSGFQPHSSRAQVSSSELGQLSAISFFTGSMS